MNTIPRNTSLHRSWINHFTVILHLLRFKYFDQPLQLTFSLSLSSSYCSLLFLSKNRAELVHRSSGSQRQRPQLVLAVKAGFRRARSLPQPPAADCKHKASVFSRISFPEGEVSRKRKLATSSSAEPATGSTAPAHHKSGSNGYYDDYKSSGLGKVVSTGGGRKKSVDYESSDDERHFKLRPSRYAPSPSHPPAHADWEEEGRHKRRHKLIHTRHCCWNLKAERAARRSEHCRTMSRLNCRNQKLCC